MIKIMNSTSSPLFLLSQSSLNFGHEKFRAVCKNQDNKGPTSLIAFAEKPVAEISPVIRLQGRNTNKHTLLILKPAASRWLPGKHIL